MLDNYLCLIEVFLLDRNKKLATVVEGDPKAPFPIASISVEGALLLSLDYSSLPLIRALYWWVLSKEVSSAILKSLVWRDLGLNPDLSDHWEALYPLGQCVENMRPCVY